MCVILVVVVVVVVVVVCAWCISPGDTYVCVCGTSALDDAYVFFCMCVCVCLNGGVYGTAVPDDT